MFFGAIFVILNLFGLTFLLRQQGELQSSLLTLRNERREANSWMAEKEVWQHRKEWLDKNQPKLQSVGEANAALLEALQTSARKQSITIMEQGFGEPNAQPSYQEISIKLKISGSLESIVRWLVETQQPESFQAIPSLSMKSDSDPSRVLCELTVARWYATLR
ncbi:MAG: hypothetical protein WCD79_03270 [Chthoniobacteraceae bacterium]